MSFKFTTLRLLLAFAILPFFTQADEFFFPWHYYTTPTSHVISLSSLGSTPTIDGVPIEAGDWIGVFYTDDCGEHCGGAKEWTGDPTAVVAFGDEWFITPWLKDGFATMEIFIWKIYSQADGQTYDALATYQAAGQEFWTGGLSYLTDLSGASPAWAVRNVQGQVLDDVGAWMENVTVTFDNSGGSASTDEYGYYCKELPSDWTGTATPSKAGYDFVPVDITYTDIMNSPREQDYVGEFTGTFYTISGTILDDASDPMEGVWVMFNSDAVLTDASGFYTNDVPEGWTGTVEPDPYAGGFDCYTFSPLNYTYTNVGEDWLNQDFTGTIQGPYTISGEITDDGGLPLENVEVDFTDIGSVFTNALGVYTVTVACGYNGTATPSMLGYSFNPLTRTYINVMGDFVAEDYVGSMFGPFAISGTITDGVDPIEGVEVVFGERSMSAFTDASGFYTYDVPFGWSGTATPGSQCYVFDPLSRTYTDVDAAIPNEDYTGTVSGTAIISGVITDGGTPVAGIDVVFDGVGTAVTNGIGEYSQEVPCGWTGDATPTSDCYTFTPALRSYSNVMGDIAGEDYNATMLGPYTISGTITDGVDPISNVAVDFEGIGSVFTDIDGDYSQEVPCGWSGDVTPISDCYTFAPEYITFTDVIADYTDQDFTGTGLGPYTLSGYVTNIATGVGMENVEVVFSGIGSVYTNASGYYSASVPCAWNGSATPFLLSWAFNPPSRVYTYVISDLTDQDFTGTQDTYTVSGYVTDGVNGLEGAQVVFNNGGGTAITDVTGYYEQEVWAGYTGTATPYWDDYSFDPPNRLYASLAGDLTDQDYVGAPSTLPPGWSYTITGSSHIISIPLSCNPNIDGIPLTPGDHIGVFFDDGGTMVCGGAVKWTGVSSVALIAYGDDLTTPEKDGFALEEPFNWKVYSWTAGEDYDAIATYDPALPQHDGIFVPDGLSALLALDATGNTFTVSGTVTLDGLPLEGVTVAFSYAGGFTETDASGFYSKTLLTNWEGIATPAKTGHNFTPENRSYAPLSANWTDQDYTAALNTYIISGMATEAGTGDPIYNVTIFLDNGGGTTHTLSTGYYSIGVLYGWTGTAYPSKDNYNFDPINRPYISVSTDLPDQDYVGEEQVWPPGWEFEITSTSHIISVPLESLPNINGVPLLADDFIGVFFYDSLGVAHCGGAAVWTGINPIAVTAYGDDSYSDEKDGFYVGEDFEWRVYSSYVGEEYNAVVTYDPALPQSNGKFYINGLSALLSLNATSTTMFTISGTILDSETSLGVEGVDVTFSNGGGVATTDATGLYSLDVLFGWSGTAEPYKVRYQFVPEYYDYFQVMEDHVDDYTAIWELIPPGWEVTQTGTSHIISVPLGALPRIDGVPLEAGDFVGVFFYDPVSGTEICGGYAEWDAVNPVAVVAYGDDLTTTEKDGFDFGEYFRWKVFSWVEYAEHEAIAVYDPTMPQYDGTFFFDGLSALLDLYADPLMVVASATPDIICYDESTQLEAVATGGSGFYTYSWTPADNLDDPTIADPIASNLLTTTTFNVVVNTFVNTADDSVEVTVYDEFLASIAADQIICYNTVPGELTSTVSGGQGNYTYQWQVYDTDWVDIENATNATYQPGALTVTTLYRLVVSEFCGTVTTNEVTVTVYGEFLASIAADQIICYNTVPDLLTSTVTGGEGTYTYQWEKKEGDLWVYIADANDPTYQPPALTISMMYRLFVTDLCGAITTDSVTITVYDDLMASIAADQVICEGTAPEELTSIVSGGEGTYTYQWQIDTTGVFEDIAGATAGTYQPGNLYGVALYQLVVTDYCGTIISDTVSITFYDALAASIAADQTICVNTAPDELTSTVTGGQGNYAYQWQLYALDSTLVENCYGLDDFAGNYYSNSLTDAGWTTYNVVEDVLIDGWTLNIGTLTADSWPSEISLWAKSPAGTSVNLYTPPSSGTFYDLALTTTDFDGEMSAGVWEIWFTDSYGDGGATAYTNSMCIGFISVGAWVDISGAYASTYQPPILTDMMLYRLEVTDFCGLIYSNEVTVTVIQLPVAYAGEDDEVCADEIYILQGDATDYSTVLWTTAGDGTFDDATLLNATYFAGSDDIDAGFADLTLTAFSIEPCTEYDEDYVTIFFTPLPTANAGDDAMICEDDFFMTMGWTTNAYGILWTTSGDGYFDNPQSTAALYFPGANDLATGFVVLTLTANPIPPCTQQVSDDMMLEFGYLPTAYAGEDATVCGLESYPLAGEATEYSTVLWTTSGDGIFDNAGSLTALYTPGDDDIANGSATLTLTVYAKAPCTGEAVDDMVLTIIPLPEANAGPDATVCEGDGYELSGATASNYGTVSWETSGTGTFDDPHILHPVYTGSSGDIANGSVVLSLTATAIVPCPGYDYDEMTLSFSLIPTADAGEDDAICEGEVYVLAGVATDYTATEWTTAGDGTFDDSALLDATYTPGPFDLLAGTVDLTLTAFAASPCPDDAVDVMTLMIALNPSADAGLDDKICEDETYTLSGMAENYDMIIWTTSGDGTFDNNTLLDATYHPGANDIILGYADLTLTAYPISPCAFAASDVMTLSIDRLPDTPGTPEGDTIVCALPVGEITDYTTTGSPNALSYYWEIFPEIAGIIEGEGTTATVTWSGDYIGLVFIKVQGINDCGAGEFSDPIEVYADDCTGLPEDLNAQLDINVYPNPSDGIFNLEISGATGMMELYILDYKGQLIHQDKIENVSGDYLKELDISTYPKGIYFLKLVGDKVMRIEKIVIR